MAAEEEESHRELKGLYKGQPQKGTSRPTSEILLEAFRGVNVIEQKASGNLRIYVTPLNKLQKRILELLNLSPDIYEGIASDFFKPAINLSET